MSKKIIKTVCCGYEQATNKEINQLISCSKCHKYQVLTEVMVQ